MPNLRDLARELVAAKRELDAARRGEDSLRAELAESTLNGLLDELGRNYPPAPQESEAA